MHRRANWSFLTDYCKFDIPEIRDFKFLTPLEVKRNQDVLIRYSCTFNSMFLIIHLLYVLGYSHVCYFILPYLVKQKLPPKKEVSYYLGLQHQHIQRLTDHSIMLLCRWKCRAQGPGLKQHLKMFSRHNLGHTHYSLPIIPCYYYHQE